MQKERAREFIKDKFAQITVHEKKTFNDNIFKNFVELFDLKKPLRIGSYTVSYTHLTLPTIITV